jgi:hypothetical protein
MLAGVDGKGTVDLKTLLTSNTGTGTGTGTGAGTSAGTGAGLPADADASIHSLRPTLNLPVFLSGQADIDHCQTDPRLPLGALQIVQHPGEMILIPPNFWHQVYHLEPSIAVASQYVNAAGKKRMFSHMLEWCQPSQLPPSAPQKPPASLLARKSAKANANAFEVYNRDSPQWSLHPLLTGEGQGVLADLGSLTDEGQVRAVIHAALRLQHGEEEGARLSKQLELSE